MVKNMNMASEGVITLDCAFCRGTGEDPFDLLSNKSLCQVCGGKEVVKVRLPAAKCAYCGGTGVHLHRRMVCTVCQGRGKVNVREPAKACPDCNGKGFEPGQYLPCLTCGGTGTVPKK